jgi:lipoprotein-anchoring transpeptidase ErfK/SrfK
MPKKFITALFAAAATLTVSTGAFAGQGMGLFSAIFDPQPQDVAVQERLTTGDLRAELPTTTREIVADTTGAAPGSIVIDTENRVMYYTLGDGRAVRYLVGVGRAGFEWRGTVKVGRKAEWPTWTPPASMLLRRPDLPRHMAGGIDNPLGARAMYLYQGNRDTMFRIHGTNEADTIGQAVSSGCIRMLNADVTDLYDRVKVGTRVVVM